MMPNSYSVVTLDSARSGLHFDRSDPANREIFLDRFRIVYVRS
jgi:hypothetical protein